MQNWNCYYFEHHEIPLCSWTVARNSSSLGWDISAWHLFCGSALRTTDTIGLHRAASSSERASHCDVNFYRDQQQLCDAQLQILGFLGAPLDRPIGIPIVWQLKWGSPAKWPVWKLCNINQHHCSSLELANASLRLEIKHQSCTYPVYREPDFGW